MLKLLLSTVSDTTSYLLAELLLVFNQLQLIYASEKIVAITVYALIFSIICAERFLLCKIMLNRYDFFIILAVDKLLYSFTPVIACNPFLQALLSFFISRQSIITSIIDRLKWSEDDKSGVYKLQYSFTLDIL